MKNPRCFFALAILAALLGIGLPLMAQNPGNANYSVSVAAVVKKTNAPALQSFVHAEFDGKWLLFAGRTNTKNNPAKGGIHNTAATLYGKSSFPYKSFNDNVFVYNYQTDDCMAVAVDTLIARLGDSLCSAIPASVFICSNPEYIQQGPYLYVVGGYGPDPDSIKGRPYQTFSTVTRINVEKMITFIESIVDTNKLKPAKPKKKFDYTDLIAIGTNPLLTCAGGELMVVGDTFYLAGGQNYGFNISTNDKLKFYQYYTNNVTAFMLTEPSPGCLQYQFVDSISDAMGDNSIFHRRDVPVVPALFNLGDSLTVGFSFYGGVFLPNGYQLPWADAIYVHPGLETYGEQYTYDRTLNNGMWNAYACANFVGYDSLSGTNNTFLLGGIGDGTDSLRFTNHGIQFQVAANLSTIQSDTNWLPGLFQNSSGYFYGAESAMILNGALPKMTIQGQATSILDLQRCFSKASSVRVGYVYGGIVAYQSNPGTYGAGNSAASNVIWEVTLTRNPAPYEKKRASVR